MFVWEYFLWQLNNKRVRSWFKIWQGSSVGESARLIPVRSRVRISPLLFFVAYSRVILRAQGFQPKSQNVQDFTFCSFSAQLPLSKTILNCFASAQSVCILMSGLVWRIKWNFKANRLCVWVSGEGNNQSICPERWQNYSFDTQTGRTIILGIALKAKLLLVKSLIYDETLSLIILGKMTPLGIMN